MRIDSLQLFQFRNYKDVQIQFNPEIIVLYGTNGAGKTNILESIYVGTIGKSYRTNDTLSSVLKIYSSSRGLRLDVGVSSIWKSLRPVLYTIIN